MRLPNFLVIGAMKSATTSLYSDLGTNPAVFLPDKELNRLADDNVLSVDGRRAYAALFRGARDDQICGDISTSYSKLPDISGVPERARRVLGREFQILYLVREPVSRTISHHYHDLTFGNIDESDVDRAVLRYPCLIDYSRYAMQIEPWLECFGEDQVRIVPFEKYVGDRCGVVAEISSFLGIEPRAARVEDDRVFNPSDLARASRGIAWRLSRLPFYRKWIRPWLSQKVRYGLGRIVLPQAPPRPDPPRLDTVDYILERVRPDAARLQRLARSDEPFWDLDTVRRRFDETSSRTLIEAERRYGKAPGIRGRA